MKLATRAKNQFSDHRALTIYECLYKSWSSITSGVSLDYVTRNMYFSEYFESSSGIQRSKRDMLAVDHPEVTKFSVIKVNKL